MKKTIFIFGLLFVIFLTSCTEERLGTGVVVEKIDNAPYNMYFSLVMPAGDTIEGVLSETDSLWYNTKLGGVVDAFYQPENGAIYARKAS